MQARNRWRARTQFCTLRWDNGQAPWALTTWRTLRNHRRRIEKCSRVRERFRGFYSPREHLGFFLPRWRERALFRKRTSFAKERNVRLLRLMLHQHYADYFFLSPELLLKKRAETYLGWILALLHSAISTLIPSTESTFASETRLESVNAKRFSALRGKDTAVAVIK